MNNRTVTYLQLHDVFFIPVIGQHKTLPPENKTYAGFKMVAHTTGVIASFSGKDVLIPWPMVKAAELAPVEKAD